MAPGDFSTLAEMLDESVSRFGTRPLFGTKKDGAWSWMTYAEFGSAVDSFKAALYALGIRHGDRVAVISGNSVEWAAAAYACYGLGAVFVPMYESQSEKEWAFIVKDSGAKMLLVADAETGNRFMTYALDHRETLFGLACGHHVMDRETFAGFSGYGLRRDRPVGPSPDDVACLVYTSGTTGDPKGVILTHANVVSNVKGVRNLGIVNEEDRSLAFLPWAHAMGHTCELHGLVCLGASIAICEGVEKIVPNLAEVRPTMLFAVPRIFNKIHAGVRKQMEAKPAFIRGLFASGL
ncbi:MAG TPA: AMP-binding protein, partial [Patescibacteria group bacterium]|nr:AMP-binding protein [Patescibacteria group bacterium]